MKIGLRGGHSKKAQGAVGIVNEYEQMQKFYTHVSKLLTEYGHTVVDCNSNAATSSAELSEGAKKANGTECIVYSETSKSYSYAKKICENFAALGFKNRGVKINSLYEMKNIKAPNIIFEICFCDSKTDIDIYNKYSWEQLAHKLCNAIDSNIPGEPEEKKAYIVTKYLPHAYEGYDGVDIKAILDKYFQGVKCYVRGDENGVWIETECISLNQCSKLKLLLDDIYYIIEN